MTKKHCVYFLKNRSGKVLYVGKTSKGMESRMYNHTHKETSMYANIARVDYYEFDNKNDADMVEIYFISKLKPIHNVEHADKKTSINFDASSLKLKVFYENNSYINHNGRLVTDIKNKMFFQFIVERLLKTGAITFDDVNSFGDPNRTNTTMLDIFYYGHKHREVKRDVVIEKGKVEKNCDYFKTELYSKYKTMIENTIQKGNSVNETIIAEFILCEVTTRNDFKYSINENLLALCNKDLLHHIHLNEFEELMFESVKNLFSTNCDNVFEKNVVMREIALPLASLIISETMTKKQNVA